MAVTFKDPTDKYRQGHYLVNVQVWKAGHRAKVVPVSDYPGKKEAKRAAEEIERELVEQLKQERDNKTFSNRSGSSLKFAETFKDILLYYAKSPLKRGKNKGKERAFNRDMSRYNRLMEDLGSCKPWDLEDALSERCTYWLDELDLDYSTVNRHITMAKSAVLTAYKAKIGNGPNRKRMIPENYLEDYPLYEENNIRFRILSDIERQILWNRLGKISIPHQKLYYHALCYPIRMSELVNIRREHCFQISNCIVLPETKVGPARTILIPEGLRDFVNNWPAGVDYLHHDEKGNPLGTWDAKQGKIVFNRYKLFKKALAGNPEAGDIAITGYNFHKTRQESAMMLYQEGKTEDEIMLIGGWNSREAFYRYFSKELALQIRTNTHNIGMAWKSYFVNEIKKVA